MAGPRGLRMAYRRGRDRGTRARANREGSGKKYDIREVGARVFEALADGQYIHVAAKCAGIPVHMVVLWRKLGRHAEGEVVDRHVVNADHIWFAEGCEQAIAAVERNVTRMWMDEIPGNWQAARDFLARRFPQRWGNTESREIGVRAQGQMELALRWGDEDDAESNSDIAEIAARAEGDREIAGALPGGLIGEGSVIGEVKEEVDLHLEDFSEER